MTKKTYAAVNGQLSTQIAIFSFAIGTVLFLTHQLFPTVDFIIIIGIYYVMTALLINSLVLLNLIHHFIFFRNHREYFAIKILIVLANLPIAAGYFYITINRINLFHF